MKKTTRKARPARRRTITPATSVPVPGPLAGLMMLLDEQENPDDVSRALAVARAALRDPLRLSPDRYGVYEEVWGYIGAEAARGPWKQLDQTIATLARPEDSDLNATAGDLQNIYACPALLIGMALAYVYVAEGGGK